MGGATSGKSSMTDATMQSGSTQDVWGGQSPALQNLYGQGQVLSQDPTGANQRAVGAYQGFAGQQPGDIYDPALAGYQGAFGGANPTAQAAGALTDPLVSGLTDIMNTQRDPFATGGSNPLLDQNVALALDQASQSFQRNVAPSIKRDAISMGQFGGTRGDLALGTAASDANRQALTAAMGAYGDQYSQDRAAGLASQIQADQTRLAAGQQIQDILGAQQAGAAQGVGVGQDLQSLGMGAGDVYGTAAQQQWSPLQQQQQILGAPTVLGASTATGASSSEPILNPFNESGGGGSKGGLPGKGGAGGDMAGGSGPLSIGGSDSLISPDLGSGSGFNIALPGAGSDLDFLNPMSGK